MTNDTTNKKVQTKKRETPPKYLLLGEVLRPHGIRGELRVRILTDYPERINDLGYVYIGKSADTTTATSYEVEHMRMHQAYGLLKLKTINDRDEAERFRQLFVMINLDNAVPLDEGEFYLYQLIGLNVQTEDGAHLGEVSDILETGANDVYVINSPQHGEILLPDIPDVILKMDVEASLITVRIPEGLLPE